MRQIRTFSDERLDGMCSYCGRYPDTRDHVPSKIFLDRPFPENLPVVACCNECNQSFSLDEEYVACLLECTLCGTTEIDALNRKKVKDILGRKPLLHQRISSAQREVDGQTFFIPEEGRVNSLLIKLAKGHAKYEGGEAICVNPTSIGVRALNTMTDVEAEAFFAPIELAILPEIGSRAMQEYTTQEGAFTARWKVVQPNAYSYLVLIDPGSILVRL